MHSRKVILAIVLIAIVGFGALWLLGYIPFGMTEATYVGVSYTSNVQTASPAIANYTPMITIETYKTKIYFWQPNCTVREATRNTFIEKLQQYNITVHITKTLKISNNATGELYFYRTFEFATGVDRKIEVYIANVQIPEGTILKVEIHIDIYVEIPLILTWQKTIDRTFYTESKSDSTNTTPYVTLVGRLVETPLPPGLIGIPELKMIALELTKDVWIQPSMSLDWQYNYLYVYLRKDGHPVVDITTLGLTTNDLGSLVQVSGQLSKDANGNLWLDVEKIVKVEVVTQ